VRVVVALGGNALLTRSERPDADIQEHHVQAAVDALAPVFCEHTVVVTHGNGPQVGVLANESEGDRALTRPYPFDALGAQTQGMIGYWLLQALENALPDRHVASLVTQTVVAADDAAFASPSKFVGPVFDADSAHRLARDRSWTVAEDGPGWRRVVPSPRPLVIVELPVVEGLLATGTVVICAGGGGIPVVRDGSGRLRGVEAVIDKDLTAALLAEALDAEALVILTDVDAVEADHGTPAARPLGRVTVSELCAMSFPAGSMGPKIEAVCRFVEATGGIGAIGNLTDAPLLLAGTAGTQVERG
jgi:carbamate kinase